MPKLEDLEKRYIQDIKSVNVWSVFRIMADFVKGFDEVDDLGPTVTIFGSLKTSQDDFYYKEAVKLSSMLAERGFSTDLEYEKIVDSDAIKMSSSRKVMLMKYSMAYIIMPGGLGTLDELFEALTLVQIRKLSGVKIILLGTEFYQPLLDFIESRLLRDVMIEESDLKMIKLTDSLESVVAEVESSLKKQIKLLKELGLDETNYYKSLSSLENRE